MQIAVGRVNAPLRLVDVAEALAAVFGARPSELTDGDGAVGAPTLILLRDLSCAPNRDADAARREAAGREAAEHAAAQAALEAATRQAAFALAPHRRVVCLSGAAPPEADAFLREVRSLTGLRIVFSSAQR